MRLQWSQKLSSVIFPSFVVLHTAAHNLTDSICPRRECAVDLCEQAEIVLGISGVLISAGEHLVGDDNQPVALLS